jgi:hypothetical protein
MTTSETQLASYFAKYDTKTAKLGKALRRKLRARLPGLSEVVYLYENQKALVIAYSPTENGYDGVFSLALYPGEVKLFFTHGPKLAKADPKKLLQGSAKMVRYVVMSSTADFDRAEIEVLMAVVLKLAKVRPDAGAKGSLIIKAESQKQRATQAARTAKARG